jgi:hypothetical protein
VTKTFLLILTYATTAFAGGGVTGEDGGHGVLCADLNRHLGMQYQYTLEVLDLFEARRKIGQPRPHVIPNLIGQLPNQGNVCRVLEL